MNEDVFREILGKALYFEFAEFDNAPEHKFSLKHRLAMKRIFARYERNLRRLKRKEAAEPMPTIRYGSALGLKQRVIIATIIIILMAFLVGWAVVFVSENFSGTVYHDNTHLRAVNTEDCPQTIEYQYALASVPEGFELTEMDLSITNVYTEYKNEITGQIIVLGQWVKTHYAPHLNTEYNPLEEVDINGNIGLCIDFSDNISNQALVVWDNGDYIIEIVADLDKDSTTKLAKINKI